MASPSSLSTHMSPPQNKYDVFLSFRGEDTRDNFTSHLHAALCRKRMETFIDNQLMRGDEISQSLLNAIERSYISIIIFSEGYASSRWCLDELVKILECKSMYGQIVLPVFYRVDPSDVRNQTGAFGDGFSKLEERFKERVDKLQKWRIALREAADLSGFDSHVIRCESVLVEKIVEDIVKRLNDMFPSDVNKDLVGIDSRIREIESLLGYGSVDVYTLGIWGMGGIGKTTIAATLFNKISSHFDGSYFIQNVREESEKAGGLAYLRRELFSTLVEDGSNLNIGTSRFDFNFQRNRLSRKKVLIIFDDVTHFGQVESLIGSLDWFMLGSLIIITTRNKQVLKNFGVKKIYEVKELAYAEAITLFSRHTFRQNYPDVGYEGLSKKIIQYAQGVPLALKVLGCHLFERAKEEWDSAINKLKRIPHMDIQEVLKISYNGLDDEEQNIFLDIACFFKAEDIDLVTKFLDASGFSAKIGISVLVDKSLIVISNNFITMHDLLQEMGREIVRQESVHDPGKHSRLWHPEDVYEVLTNNTGTKAIQGISLDMSKVGEISLNFHTFKKMCKLRFLKFYGENKCKICHFGGFGYVFTQLRYLHWQEYPLKLLPSNIHTESLVLLVLPNSKVEQRWDGVQNLVSLKEIHLMDSKQLTKLPDLSLARNLEKLSLYGCCSLVETHSSIQYLNKLVFLDLQDCRNLKSLPRSICSESLEAISLTGCSNLRRLPDVSCNIEWLYSERTAIEELPSSIKFLSRLDTLNLQKCLRLENLPSSLFDLKSLQFLDLSGCSNLKRFPEISACNLESLYLDGTAIEELPPSIEFLSRLVRLDLQNCSRLESLPSSLCKLKSLEDLKLSSCSNLQRLPDELGNLKALKWLRAERTAIRKIPLSIVCLNNLVELYFEKFRGHEQMSFILPISVSLDGLYSLRFLKLADCGITDLPENLGHLSSLEELYLDRNDFEKIPEDIINLHKLRKLYLSSCERLQSLPKLPCSLYYIDANYCKSLEGLSGLSVLFTIQTSFEYYQSYGLGNRFKLDQNELREICEDALQKIQLIATAWQKEQAYVCNAGGHICFPGSEIPEWFKFQSIGSCIALELPQGWFDNKLVGFALCAVVAFPDHHDSEPLSVRCDFKLKMEDGDWHVISRLCFGSIIFVESDHIIMGYDFSISWDLVGEYHYHNEALFHFYVPDYESGEQMEMEVRKCGIHLFYVYDFGASLKNGSRSFSTNEEEELRLHPKRLKYTTSF